MACPIVDSDIPIHILLLKVLSMIPTYHYILSISIVVLIFLYNFLEFHVLVDFLRGLKGDRVVLTFNPASKIYEGVASRCRILHGRYLATPWLASPHFQTAFLNFFGRPPKFCYRRQLYKVHDGGTIALDWLLASDVTGNSYGTARVISKEDLTPLVIVVPGLTSDSDSAYIKHLVHKTARQGWNVVVGNHRGLGGISITSDRFYNAGWTDDVREVINYLHQEYPKAPLFAVGTSIGANILVKYLGEEGENTPLAGAASICSPWDLVVCDRFINRKLVQRLYDRALAIGLKGYAQLHQTVLTRLANWDGISSGLEDMICLLTLLVRSNKAGNRAILTVHPVMCVLVLQSYLPTPLSLSDAICSRLISNIQMSRSVRDFDNHATCLVGKFETVDSYYRHCSSVSFVRGVSVPLLCISALDDPVCTREAIPWDECRANKNIVLATLPHGGHLGFFEGIMGHSLWWVGAVCDFLSVLYSSPYMHGQQQMENTGVHYPLESSIDKSPFVNVLEDGLVSAERRSDGWEGVDEAEQNDHRRTEDCTTPVNETTPSSVQNAHEERLSAIFDEMTGQVKRSMNQLSRQSGKSIWLLAYIAIVATWPLLGSFLGFAFRKKSKGASTAAGFGR